jgi:hypothetical protein
VCREANIESDDKGGEDGGGCCVNGAGSGGVEMVVMLFLRGNYVAAKISTDCEGAICDGITGQT